MSTYSNDRIVAKAASAAAAGALIMFGAGASWSAELGAADETIKLAINEWTGQVVTTHVAGNLLERIGYSVEYVAAGNYPQHQALADGDIHATLEVWTNNSGDIYPIKKEAGEIVDIGSLGLQTNEGWVYPKHMEEMCPGLPNWEALIDCKDVMVTPDTFPQGRILSYPADWGTRSADIIAGLELDYKAIPAGNEGALVAELKGAQTGQKPLVMMFWAPHWIFAEVEVGWVQLPEWAPECHTDPAWGPNPDAVNDCGVFIPDTMKVAWSGFEEKWPAAWELLSSYVMDTGQQEAMIGAVDNEGREVEEVAAEWAEQNEAVWKPWVDAALGG